MTYLSPVVTFVLVAFIWLASVLQRKGKMTLRWWVLPVFLISVILSFPMTLIWYGSEWMFESFGIGAEQTECFQTAWLTYGWCFLFTWIMGLLAILFFNGARFASVKIRWLVLIVIVAVTMSLVALDALLWVYPYDEPLNWKVGTLPVFPTP